MYNNKTNIYINNQYIYFFLGDSKNLSFMQDAIVRSGLKNDPMNCKIIKANNTGKNYEPTWMRITQHLLKKSQILLNTP